MTDGIDEDRARRLLMAATDTADLRSFLQQRFGQLAEIIATATEMPAAVDLVLETARREGWLDRLSASPPRSADVTGTTPARSGHPGSPMDPLHGFLDLRHPVRSIGATSEAIDHAQARVFAIEVDGAHRGTAFLIGPDLAMTNYHVVAGFVTEGGGGDPRAIGRLTARFDKVLDGQIGEVIGLASDWLVVHSPHHALDCERGEHDCTLFEDALDFAILRLDRLMGLGHAPGRRIRRGWYHLKVKPHELETESRLLAVQHPLGTIMSYDEGRVLSVNGNATRARYRINTAKGSSGGPVLDMDADVIVMHHAGDPDVDAPQYTQGIPIRAIVGKLDARGFSHLLTPPPQGLPPFLEIDRFAPVVDRLELQAVVVDMCEPGGGALLCVDGAPGSGRQFTGEIIQHVAVSAGWRFASASLDAYVSLQVGDLCGDLALDLGVGIGDMPPRPTDRQCTRWPGLLARWLVGKLRERFRVDQVTTWIGFDCVDAGMAPSDFREFVVTIVERTTRNADVKVVVIGAEALLPPRHLDRADKERVTPLAPADVSRYLVDWAHWHGHTLRRADAEALAEMIFDRLPAAGIERWEQLIGDIEALVHRLKESKRG